EETGPVLGERAAVDREDRRIALAFLEAGRADDPSVDLVAVLGGCGESLRLCELASLGERRSNVGQLPALAAGEALAQGRVGRRRVDELPVADVVAGDRLLAADEALRAARTSCAHGAPADGTA